MGAKASKPRKKTLSSLRDTATSNAFDTTSPCYSFQKVLQAQTAFIFMNPNPTNPADPTKGQNHPLLFSDAVPFSMASVYMMQGLAAVSSSQQGPVLSEEVVFPAAPGFIPFGQTSPVAAAQYSFVNQNDKIWIAVSQQLADGNVNTGYLTFAENPSCARAYTSQVVSAGSMPSGAGFGVVWALTPFGQAGGLLLTYSDSVGVAGVSAKLVGVMGTDASGNLLTTQLFSGYYDVAASATATNIWYGLFDSPTPIAMSYDSSTMQLASSSPAFNIPRNSIFGGKSSTYPPFINMAMWQCVAGKMDAIAAKYYMANNCMGTSTICMAGASLCTPFSAGQLDSRGNACQFVAMIDTTATDAAYQTVCGIDPDTNQPANTPPDSSVVDALSTLDCACVNYEQSTYKVPQFKQRNFQDFSNFLSDNGLPLFDSGDPMCWWPPCTAAITVGQPFSLPLSAEKMSSITGVCPSTTMCINEVTLALKGNSKVNVNALNDCYQGPSRADGPAPPPPAPKQSSFDKLLHSKTLQITAGIVGVVLLLFIIYVIMNPKLPPTVPQKNYRPPTVPQTYNRPPTVPQTYYRPPTVPKTYYRPPTVPQTYYRPPTVPQTYYRPSMVPQNYYK